MPGVSDILENQRVKIIMTADFLQGSDIVKTADVYPGQGTRIPERKTLLGSGYLFFEIFGFIVVDDGDLYFFHRLVPDINH